MQTTSFDRVFRLTNPAKRLLARFGVERPAQLITNGVQPIDILRNMLIGREIVQWAKLAGVTYGPSRKWWTVLNDAETLSVDSRRALWLTSLVTTSPEEIDYEDVTMKITSSNTAKNEFRHWASDHNFYFGPPTLVGISSLKTRQYLRRAGFRTEDEVADCTIDEFQAATNKGEQFLREIEQWLISQGRRFADPDVPLAPVKELSPHAKHAVRLLGIRTKPDVQKLRLSSLNNVPFCKDRTVTEILSWAKSLGFEVPP